MARDKLPSFKRPPVVETVLGVQFDQLPKVHNAHLGVFWDRLGAADWPNVSEAPPLEQLQELFGEQRVWRSVDAHLTLTEAPPLRFRIRNAANNRMIQIQNGRLHYNWLQQEEGDYPRYRTVRPEFDEVLQSFKQFLDKQSLGEMVPNLWEVTYVNHLPRGTVWNDYRDWSGLFPTLPGAFAEIAAARLEGFEGHWHFEIEPQKGRLHVEVKHGRAGSSEGPEILVMKSTARGRVYEETDLSAGLDLGRRTIVNSFVELTSEAAHTYWGLQK